MSKITEQHKFKLIDEFEIIVPNDYKPNTYIKSFRKKHESDLFYYNDNITDKNFKNPSRILKPGDSFICKVFFQIKPSSTTSEERIAFLKLQNAIFLGAQGACLVYEQQKDKLPKGKWYLSFDEKERLWEDSDGDHRVPGMLADSDGGFRLFLGYFESVWYDNDALLCFCEKKLSKS